jgi:hypothetical protein
MENDNTSLVTKSTGTTASKLLASEKYSDLTILCHGREFKVHKAILCPQSEVFSKICDTDMQEKRTGTIEHEEFDDDTMQRMIEFAYGKEYSVTCRPKYVLDEDVEASATSIGSLAIEAAPATGGVTLWRDDGAMAVIDKGPVELSIADKLVIHARVYGLADYYDMPELRDYAYHCFMDIANAGLEDVDLEGFDNVVREVCRTTIRGDCSAANMYGSPLRSGFHSFVALYAPKLALDANFTAALC